MKEYIPVIARDRKRDVDRLFMAYKMEKDNSFRYIVKSRAVEKGRKEGEQVRLSTREWLRNRVIFAVG